MIAHVLPCAHASYCYFSTCGPPHRILDSSWLNSDRADKIRSLRIKHRGPSAGCPLGLRSPRILCFPLLRFPRRVVHALSVHFPKASCVNGIRYGYSMIFALDAPTSFYLSPSASTAQGNEREGSRRCKTRHPHTVQYVLQFSSSPPVQCFGLHYSVLLERLHSGTLRITANALCCICCENRCSSSFC